MSRGKQRRRGEKNETETRSDKEMREEEKERRGGKSGGASPKKVMVNTYAYETLYVEML